MKMTPELVADICKERHLWSQPHLNTQLFLHGKGFDAIQGLEDYCNVRALYLGNNNISSIQGLFRMSDLRNLHLEGNRIPCIENLGSNLELRHLNLESNAIRTIGDISHLTKLEYLNVAKNLIDKLEDLDGIKSISSLTNLDISFNHIEAHEGVVEFFSDLSHQLKILRYHGNPGVRNIDHYRKRMVNTLPELRYLDERPVFPVERRSSAAWAQGGLQAMQQAKKDFFQEQHRQQNVLDPERGAFLTQQRKAAIARIEREERERNQAAPQEDTFETRVQAGDPEALEEYANRFRMKVQFEREEQARSEAPERAFAAGPIQFPMRSKASSGYPQAQGTAKSGYTEATIELPVRTRALNEPPVVRQQSQKLDELD